MKEDSDKWNEHLKKERERDKVRRQEEKIKCEQSDIELVRKRERIRLRVQKCRRKKTVDEVDNRTPEKLLGSYASKSTLRKAVFKAKKNLPLSPRKKKAVIRQLIKETFDKPNDIFAVKKQSKPKVSQEDVEKIKMFYESDEVSWQAPGKRDYISIKNESGKKIKKQRRYLIMGIDEVQRLFMQKYGIKVGRSRFYELRPKHVLFVANTPHNVCVCKEHANFKFLVDTISSHCSTSLTHKSLLEKMCCDVEDERCMTNKCEVCCYDVSVCLKADVDQGQELSWREWSKCNGQLQVQENIATLEDIVIKVNASLPHFKTHTFVRDEQLKYFDNLKQNLDVGDAVIQVDFAENYSIISQDEIQTAHWSHSQVTVFTCCLWLKEFTTSWVVVSDDLSHSKNSTWTYVKCIISNFKMSYPELELNHLYFFSDNCSAQFKSKYTAFNMLFLADDLCVKTVEWNTFAAGHGKGAVDAIGGNIKRAVWTAVKARAVTVRTPEEFYKTAESHSEKTHILYVSQKEIQECSTNFLDQRWKNATDVHGIRNIHHLKRLDDFHISVALTSNSVPQKVKMLPSLEMTNQRSKRYRYSDVYSSSESDIDGSASEKESEPTTSSSTKMNDPDSDIDGSASQKESVPTTSTSTTMINPEAIAPGVYVIINIEGESKEAVKHKYVGICQTRIHTEHTSIHEEGDVGVLFLKNYGSSGRIFVADQEDEKNVNFKNEIEAILPPPAIKEIGSRLVYEFKKRVML